MNPIDSCHLRFVGAGHYGMASGATVIGLATTNSREDIAPLCHYGLGHQSEMSHDGNTVIYLKGDSGFKISEMVYVGPEHLVGEIIGLKKGMTTVQVFEETTGLKSGDTVTGTGDAISVLLGPGIIHNIFDGIQRPLEEILKPLSPFR